jgi:hypothetical protein
MSFLQVATVVLSAALATSSPSARPTTVASSYSPLVLEEARREFQRGVEAARERRWPDALAFFSRAYELVPQPQALFNLAGAQLETGRVVAAAQSYRRFLAEIKGTALDSYRAPAMEALHRAEGRIGWVLLRPTTRDELGLFLDGRPVDAAQIASEIPVDPGEHVVSVLSGSREVSRSTFAIGEAQHREVVVTVSQSLFAPTLPSPPSLTSSSEPLWRSHWFWVGLGAAVVATGATVYVLQERPYSGTLGRVDVR